MTEQAKWPVKRPLAFAIQTHKGNWILYNDEEIAAKVADEKGLDYHGLYLRDGCAGIIAQRDQLLAALEAMVCSAEYDASGEHLDLLLENARAAIAAVEEKS